VQRDAVHDGRPLIGDDHHLARAGNDLHDGTDDDRPEREWASIERYDDREAL
jgi:hypothetical protein